MVSLFIIAFVSVLVVLFISGLALDYWQKSARDDAERILPPSPDFHGLFGDQATKGESKKPVIARHKLAGSPLLHRAQEGDKTALAEAKQSDDKTLYERVLNALIERANSDAALLSLISFVAQNDLPVNGVLAKAAVNLWQAKPDRSSTAKALHFAALSDDADLYCQVIEQTLQFWRAGKLDRASAAELRALFEGEFWILSSRTRSSGAGFVLKRTLDSARRELDVAAQNKESHRRSDASPQAFPNGRSADTE